jgi:hypothetical protein
MTQTAATNNAFRVSDWKPEDASKDYVPLTAPFPKRKIILNAFDCITPSHQVGTSFLSLVIFTHNVGRRHLGWRT